MNTATPAAPETFAAELVRRGLPVEYAKHVASELNDHRRDLIAELLASGFDQQLAPAEAARRLGDASTLVKKTVREYQRRFWCGRWRLITFLLAPIPSLFMLWTASILAYGGLILGPLHMLSWLGPPAPADGVISTGEWLGTCAVQAWFMFILPAAVMFGLARFGRRAAMGWTWVLLSACTLAFSVCFVKYGFPIPELNHRYLDGTPVPADRPLLTMTLVIPGLSKIWWAWYRAQALPMLLPLVVATLMLLRSRQLAQRREQLVLGSC